MVDKNKSKTSAVAIEDTQDIKASPEETVVVKNLSNNEGIKLEDHIDKQIDEKNILPYTADGIEARLKEFAKNIDINEYFITEKSCKDAVKYVCNYSLKGNIGLLVSADSKKQNATDVTLIFAKDGNPLDLFIHSGLLIGATDATLLQDERGEILTKTLFKTVKDKKDHSIIKNGYEYKSTFSEFIGIWFLVQREK